MKAFIFMLIFPNNSEFALKKNLTCMKETVQRFWSADRIIYLLSYNSSCFTFIAFQMELFSQKPSQRTIHWNHRLSHGFHSQPSTIAVRKSQIVKEEFQEPNFDLSRCFVPSRENRNSVAETNFVGLGFKIKPTHRDSYASLD